MSARSGRACALAVALAVAAPAAAQVGVGQEGTYLIRGATVVTGNGQRIPNGSVLIQAGKIAAVGASVQAPANATVIDANGMFVYPGMIDSYTAMGLAEIGGIATMNLRSELGQFNPHMRAVVAINMDSEMLGITRANGVTSVLTTPSSGIISGQAAMINTAGWTWEDIAVKTTAAYVINYPRAGGGGGRGGGGGGGRGGGGGGANAEETIRELKQLLAAAKEYDRARDRGLPFDQQYEAMRPLVNGTVPAIVSADTEEQIRGAIALSDTFGIKVIIYGGDEAWKVMDQLSRRSIPVVLGSIQSTPPADMPYDAIYAQPGILHKAGIKIAFSTGGASDARHVPYHASLAMAYGLPADAALQAVTLWPAQIFGVADQIGSIEVGKMANVFVADGDALDPRTHVIDVFIKGRRLPADDRHSQFYQKYNARPKSGGGS
jgi:imidazolonepropionase-like amidohydrolase